MFEFSYERAKSIQHALELLRERKAHLLAGGTDLILKIKHGRLKPNLIISIGKLDELRFIEESNGYIHIGAMVKINELLESQLLQSKAPLLLRVAKEIGSPEIRNMATLGGNICCVRANCGACVYPSCKISGGGPGPRSCKNASFSDLIVPLAALDARLVVATCSGEREIKVRDLLQNNAALKRDEILKEVYFTPQSADGWGYSLLRTAKAMGVTVLSAAAILKKIEDGSVEVTLVLGGSLRRAVIVSSPEVISNNNGVNSVALDTFINKALQELSYVDNLAMPLDYIEKVAPVLIKDSINQAMGCYM